MEQGEIRISTMLAEIELPDGNWQPRTFSIAYYKTDGTKGSKAAVRKGGLAGAGPEGSSAFRYKVKQGSLQLLDCATNQYFTLKTSLLTEYNGLRILHEELAPVPPPPPIASPAQHVAPEPEPAPRRRRRYRPYTED